MRLIRIWFRASRPFTFSGAVVPVLVGTSPAFREGQADLWLFLLVFAACLLVQIATNMVDEYSDHNRPEGQGKLLAPYKVIALGLLSAGAVKLGAAVCFGIATAIGIYLIIRTGWPILAICAASLIVAYFYSAGRLSLGKIGLGQPLVFVFMGPVMVMGAYYVQTQSFTMASLWLSLPVACTVTAILAANDLRDFEEDRAAGKRTPVTVFGRRFGRWEWLGLVVTAYLIVFGLVVTGSLGIMGLLPLLALPQATRTFRLIWNGQERAQLAPALPATAIFHGQFGFLLAAGIVLERLLS